MNDQLKQRLVGAIVLVSLAVIFLPMVFKGDGGELDNKAVPPEPDYRFPPPKETPKPPPMASTPIVPIGDSGSEKASTKSADQSPVVQATNESEPEEKISEPVAVTPKAQKKQAARPGQVEAWIVQVGSFTSEPNAISLRDRLRRLGFATFVEAVKGNKVMAYRVRVGPELTRELADKLKTDVEKKAGLKGLVQSYP